MIARWWASRTELDVLIGRMSAAWIAEQKRQLQRIEYHGPQWAWPIRKRELDRGWRNRQRNKVA